MDSNLCEPCEDCNAESGEPCRPYCTGKAHQQETLLDLLMAATYRP